MIVGVSGGADSMALLDALLRIRERDELTIVAAHYEHGIRGEASKEDARFVEAYCRERGVECVVGHGDVPAYAKEKKLSLETAARELRHQFLRRVHEEKRADGIALAHHRDDQVETVLMHFLRGAGMQGLKGMLYEQNGVYRPLLDATKAEIYDYCKERDIPYREDATNEIADAMRNKLRLEILPYIRESINPSVDEAVARLADIMQAEDILADEEAKTVLREAFIADPHKQIWCVHRRFFSPEVPIVLQRRCLRRVSEKLSGSDGWAYREIERLREAAGRARGEKWLSMPAGAEVYIGYAWVFLYKKGADWEKFADFVAEKKNIDVNIEDFPPHKEKKRKQSSFQNSFQKVPLEEGLNRFRFTDCMIEMKRVSQVGERDADTIYADALLCREGLYVRPRGSGDRIALPAGHRKIKDLLIDAKVARAKRDTVPIVLLGDEILWAAGVRRSTLAYVTENTKQIMRLKLLWKKSR
ncbi:hypothetical protein TAMA11512_16680 [Selenomonas sp. TAMA-11512]|nr:hypothetical protein TAMA11512_16680 [Selenomonas sp. TAMA-11512]